MIFTDTSSPLDLDMVVLQDCRGPETDGSGWFARVLRTPANRGETHGPEGECVVTGFDINTTTCLKCQRKEHHAPNNPCELTHVCAHSLRVAPRAAHARTSVRSEFSSTAPVRTTGADIVRSNRTGPTLPRDLTGRIRE